MLWCSAHEYTQSNAKWAVTVDPNNKKLQQRKEQIDGLRSKVGLRSNQLTQLDGLGCAAAACPHVTLRCASGQKGEDTRSGGGECVRPSNRKSAVQQRIQSAWG